MDNSKVTIQWLQDALSSKEKWASRANKFFIALESEEITTTADVIRSGETGWNRIIIDGRPLPWGVVELIKSKAASSNTFDSDAPMEYGEFVALLQQIREDIKRAYPANCYEQNVQQELLGQTEALTMMQQALINNYNNIDTKDKSLLTILTVFDFVGISKIAPSLKLNDRAVSFATLNFSNGDALDNREDFSVALGLRVFAQLCCKVNYQLFVSGASRLLSNEQAKRMCTLPRILRVFNQMDGGNTSACVIHFDEVNLLPQPVFEQLIMELGSYMFDPINQSLAAQINFPLLPIISGTNTIYNGPIRLSRFGSVTLPAPPLNYKSSSSL